MEIGSTGTLTFGDGTSAKVRLVDVDNIAYWLEYVEGETNRQIIHPDFGKSPFIWSEIVLPPAWFRVVVKPDK
jgi:hypothetical protein